MLLVGEGLTSPIALLRNYRILPQILVAHLQTIHGKLIESGYPKSNEDRKLDSRRREFWTIRTYLALQDNKRKKNPPVFSPLEASVF